MQFTQVSPWGRAALLTLGMISLALRPSSAQQDVITTFIGGGPNNIPAVNSDVHQPYAIVIDAEGNYYFPALAANRVFKVDTNGVLTVLAGNGAAGETGDGIPGGAANAELNGPAGLARDSSGNFYISDYNSCVVRKVDTKNTITTIAGIAGSCGYAGDNGVGTSAKLNNPRGLALDSSGNLYIADYTNCRVRALALATDTITTYAGDGKCSFGGDGGPPTTAGLAYPMGLAVDSAGDLFIGDYDSYRIREVTAPPNSIINTVAGTGSSGTGCPAGPATSTAIGTNNEGLSVDPTGTIVTFADLPQNCIRQFTVGGTMSTIAGKNVSGFCGDGGPAIDACFNAPIAAVADALGNYYVADQSNNRIREFTVGGNITTIAGNGSATYPTLVSGEPAQGVVFNSPTDVMEDPAGNVYVAENTNCMVRELVKSTGLVNIFAGSAMVNAVAGSCGFAGMGGPATSALLGSVSGIARDSNNNIYIADESNCVVWEVSAASGDISLFAGVYPKQCGYNGDNIAATSAELDQPYGLAVDSQNNVYIGDFVNNRVRKVTGGVITTIAGNGAAGYAGDGDPAISAELHGPVGVAVDSAGDVYIADYSNCVAREVVASTGLIFTVAGNGVCQFNGDGIATEHELDHPYRVNLDVNGNLFVADETNYLVRWINLEGMMTTIAGNHTAGFSGDGGLATSAELNDPVGVAQHAAGGYLVADYSNSRIRQISPFSALNMSASALNFGLGPVGGTSQPQIITLSTLGPLTFSSIAVSGPFAEADDCGAGIPNEGTCSVYVTFQPTAAGVQTGAIVIEDNGFFVSSSTISLEGTGTAISVTGGPLAFGNQAAKTKSAPKSVTVTNKGALGITMGAISVSDADFIIGSNTCPVSGGVLAAGAKCTVSIAFKPTNTGVKKGALVINDSDPSSPQIVGLSGVGTSLVLLTPSTIAFPTQAVGTISSLSRVTLTNNTAASLTLSRTAAVTVTGPFTISTGATFCTNGLVVPIGGSCYIYLEFTPTAVGYPIGTLSVADSDSTSPQTVSLSGTATGIAFNPPSVSLSAAVGHPAQITVSIANVGSSTVTLTAEGITGPNAKDFTTTGLTDPPCGGSIAAGGFCANFTLSFTPSLVGSESATLLIYDNSPGSPQKLVLSGTGQ